MGIVLFTDQGFQADWVLGNLCLAHFSSGIANFWANSSGVGSRPISVSIWREVRTNRLIVWIMF
jgi:hypothetical protein